MYCSTFTKLFFFSLTETVSSLVIVIQNQQTHTTRPSFFCSQNGHTGHAEPRCFVGPCKDMHLLYRITDINHPNFPLWLTPYKKGNDSTINLSVTFCPSKNLLIPNCFSSASLGKHIKTKDVLQRQDILWIGIRG